MTYVVDLFMTSLLVLFSEFCLEWTGKKLKMEMSLHTRGATDKAVKKS